MNLDRTLLQWARLAGRWLVAAALAGLGGGMLTIAQAWLLSQVIAGVFLGGQGLAEAAPALAGLLGVFLGRAGLSWAQEAAGAAAAAQIKNELRERLMAQLFRLGPAYVQGEQSGELTATAVQGVEALDAYYSQFLPQWVLAVGVPLSILGVVFPRDVLSGAVLMLTGPLIPLFMVLIGKSAQVVTRRQFTALGRMSAFFLDTLQGLATLKQFNQSQARVAQIAQVSERYRARTMEVLRLTFLSALALELAATLSTAVVAVEIGLRLLYGYIEFQPAFFVLLLAPEFYLPLRLLGQRFHAGAAGAAAGRRIQAVLALEQAVAGGPPEGAGVALPEPPRVIMLEKVTFQYAGRSEPALDGIDLELRRGQLTALVGASGAGKSTLAYLLLGFLQAQSGSLRVDGVDWRELSLSAWRRQVAWVPQRPYLFQDTLAANIRLGRPEASLAEVQSAARLAGLDEFAGALPLGYDTHIGEQGARLSGGQAQRLALARAFLMDAPLILLDEPTAQLDPELEDQLGETTARLCRGRMAVVIAHRLASLRHADQIVVLERGRIVAQGAAAAMLAAPGGALADLLGDFE